MYIQPSFGATQGPRRSSLSTETSNQTTDSSVKTDYVTFSGHKPNASDSNPVEGSRFFLVRWLQQGWQALKRWFNALLKPFSGAITTPGNTVTDHKNELETHAELAQHRPEQIQSADDLIHDPNQQLTQEQRRWLKTTLNQLSQDTQFTLANMPMIVIDPKSNPEQKAYYQAHSHTITLSELNDLSNPKARLNLLGTLAHELHHAKENLAIAQNLTIPERRKQTIRLLAQRLDTGETELIATDIKPITEKQGIEWQWHRTPRIPEGMKAELKTLLTQVLTDPEAAMTLKRPKDQPHCFYAPEVKPHLQQQLQRLLAPHLKAFQSLNGQQNLAESTTQLVQYLQGQVIRLKLMEGQFIAKTDRNTNTLCFIGGGNAIDPKVLKKLNGHRLNLSPQTVGIYLKRAVYSLEGAMRTHTCQREPSSFDHLNYYACPKEVSARVADLEARLRDLKRRPSAASQQQITGLQEGITTNQAYEAFYQGLLAYHHTDDPQKKAALQAKALPLYNRLKEFKAIKSDTELAPLHDVVCRLGESLCYNPSRVNFERAVKAAA